MSDANTIQQRSKSSGIVRSLQSKFYICGFLLALPVFVSVSGSGIALPENHYEMSGIPLHLNVLALLFILPYVKFTKTVSLGIFIFLLYLSISAFQSLDRVLFAIQSVYFLVCFYFFNSLNTDQIYKVSRGATYALFFFCGAHLLSIVVNSGGSPVAALGEGSKFWGLSIYQSYLTYPVVLVFGLLLYYYDRQRTNSIVMISFIFVLLLELILMRRVALSLFLLLTLLYQRNLFLSFAGVGVLIGLMINLLGLGFDFSDIWSSLTLVSERLLSGEFTRQMTWERSIGYLSEVDILLLGNGRNNHSHNWFMHTITTHGIFYSAVLFSLVGITIAKFFVGMTFSLRPILLIFAVILIDWNLNVNLYQPYYAGMFALTLVTLIKNYQFKLNVQEYIK